MVDQVKCGLGAEVVVTSHAPRVSRAISICVGFWERARVSERKRDEGVDVEDGRAQRSAWKCGLGAEVVVTGHSPRVSRAISMCVGFWERASVSERKRDRGSM